MMSPHEQKKLLETFIDGVKEELIKRSDRWPPEWDGHELRELAADAFDCERTALMKTSRKRLREYQNECLVNNLF
jgi:hypothetical protein